MLITRSCCHSQGLRVVGSCSPRAVFVSCFLRPVSPPSRRPRPLCATRGCCPALPDARRSSDCVKPLCRLCLLPWLSIPIPPPRLLEGLVLSWIPPRPQLLYFRVVQEANNKVYPLQVTWSLCSSGHGPIWLSRPKRLVVDHG